MRSLPQFEIKPKGSISNLFIENNIFNLDQAIDFIRKLPYGRNANKRDLTTLFGDACGTCSTKHALLKQLADENSVPEIKLFIGLFKMNGLNTPIILTTLKKYGLEYMPEAHCYLKYKDIILDCTFENSKASDFMDDLIEEIEIAPTQILGFKQKYHKNYLDKWLKENLEIDYSPDEFWSIREQCIFDLQNHN
ncbi:MAG TPA: hypothetical protein VK590_01755 [Saprospiraceae bacterium]|nr:hypothetical protein [Saprospiraceae bacterium]